MEGGQTFVTFGASTTGNFTTGVGCRMFQNASTNCTLLGGETIEAPVEGNYVGLGALPAPYHYVVYLVP